MQSLYDEGKLEFNKQIRAWQWQIEDIKSAQISANVVDLMVNKIYNLDPTGQELIQLAACLGSRFNLTLLSWVYEKSLAETAADLFGVIQAGLIVPQSESYQWLVSDRDFDPSALLNIECKFLHDRVLEAAVTLISEERQQEIHLKIGQLLLENIPPTEREEHLFEIVNHLNRSKPLIEGMPEDLGLIELNLQAGQKAKASAAYETALKYFTTARSLLSETSWDSNYHLTLQIHQNQAECQYFITQFDQAEANFQEILNTAHNPLDRATIYNIQVLLYTNLGQNFDAVEIGVNALLCTPIINQGKLSGVIYLENNLATGAFTPERIELLQVISSQAAISLENAQLYRNLEDKVIERTAQLASANEEISALNERLKSDNLRMSAELDITRQLQQKMLPRPEELQEISGLEIAGFMEAADEVGGDYYDVLNYDGRIKIGIGDVTGHGLESGMVMVQTAVRTLLANNETDYIKFLSTLNRTIYDNVERMNADKNLTLVLLDYADGVLQISGQHEEIIVVRANGDIERIDTINLGFPIGLVTEIADFITQSEVQLNPGDGVVLYTDGITEAANMTNKQYGIERLCEVASQNWQYSAEEVRKIVIEDLRKFIGEQKVFDDITLVVLKPK